MQALVERGEPGVAHVRVDDRDRRAGEIGEREAELDDQRRHRDEVIRRHEPDHPDALLVDPPRDAGRRRLHHAVLVAAQVDAERCEDRVGFVAHVVSLPGPGRAR
jgi:hypothetical protein